MVSSLGRRALLGVFTLGAAGLTACARTGRRSKDNPTSRENRNAGDPGWRVSSAVSDTARQIQGYASTTSVNAGDTIDFHVSVAEAQPYTVALYRVGHYDGAGARLMHTSGELAGVPREIPAADPDTGLIDCRWPSGWTFRIPGDWHSGLFFAVFRSADGFRSTTPFVVRNDGRRSELLFVVPFTTYAAYNVWPADGCTGRNFYKGYRPDGSMGGIGERAVRVSFNRPFAGNGMPSWVKLDIAAAQWAEANSYDVSYATSIDLHEGRVDPGRHRGLVFPGHDEYWSGAMRAVVEKAVRTGTHCAFLAANNIYWNVRVEADPQGRPGRVVTCYKDDPDPAPDETGPTKRWRSLGTAREHAEARLLGVQYNGILAEPAPLVVHKAAHWFWAGTGVRDGDEIRDLVAVEADGCGRGLKTGFESRQTVLARSPYQDRLGRGEKVQNTSLCRTPEGTIMFCAGTFHWPLALVESKVTDERIQRATKNLFDRFLR